MRRAGKPRKAKEAVVTHDEVSPSREAEASPLANVLPMEASDSFNFQVCGRRGGRGGRGEGAKGRRAQEKH